MRIGLMIDPIDLSLSYEDNLKKTRELGFEVIQLWYKDIVQYFSIRPEDFMVKLHNMGLELTTLAAYTDIMDRAKSRTEIIDGFKRIIDYASTAGVEFVVTESGGKPGQLDLWEEMISRFVEITDFAESTEVKILIENGPGVLVGNTELMLRMIKDVNSDALGINFDPANLILIPDDVVTAVETLGSYILNTHAKDAILLKKGSERDVPSEHIFKVPEGEEFIHIPEGVQWVLPPVGDGDVPFSDYIAALKKVGFRGDLIIEFQGGGSREEAILKSKRFLEKVLSKA